MKIYRVSFKETLADWDQISVLIDRVLQRCGGEACAEHIMTCLQKGDMQIWRDSGKKAIAITQILQTPNFSKLHVYLVAGEDAEKWVADGQQTFDTFASQNGCKYVEFQGRPGWERLLKSHGYTEKLIVMRKEIDSYGQQRRRQYEQYDNYGTVGRAEAVS